MDATTMPFTLRWRLVTSLAVAGGLALAVGGVALPAEAATKTGVATTTVNIRSKASTGGAKVGELVRGQRITVTGSAGGGWVKVRFNRGTAYMYGSYLNQSGRNLPAAPSRVSTSTAKITTEAVNVRSGPGTTYKIVGSLTEGSGVRVTGTFRSGFAEFAYGSSKRWISMAYLATRVGGTVSAPPPATTPAPPPASNRGTKALAFAKSQLGKPYVFGAAGPNSYDCSGLVQAAWRYAGVSIPRVTYTQFTVGTPVSQANLKPGDLVFFYGPSPSHVGIYAGNGQIIHSPRPGRVVEYTKISYMPFAGARRPG